MRAELVGRRAELEALIARLERALDGAGGLVLLSGDAGVGKTRLAAELARRAGDRPVLTGRATQAGTAPYAPLVAALRSFLHAAPAGLDRCGPLRGHLAQLLPELGPAAPDADRATLVEALRCAFEHVAPALVILEDLQWSDEATLDVLAALAEPLRDRPLLVVATYRTDGLPRGHGIRRLRHDLRRSGLLDEIALHELEPAETATLLTVALGEPASPALAATVHDRTAGVPFFIEELAGALELTGALRSGPDGLELGPAGDVPIPDSVRDAVLVRAAELTEAGRRAAEVAAVAGDGFDLRVVAEVAGDPGLAELLDGGLVAEDAAGRGRFHHALARDALYADLPWTQRRRRHAELAAALERHGAPSRDVAAQWLGARDDGRARAALETAAAESEAVHAYRDAAEAGRQALELWPDGTDVTGRVAALERYARCSQLAGELGEAARAWRELADAAEGDDRLGVAQRGLAGVHELRGDAAAAVTAHLAAGDAFAAAGRVADAVVERLAVASRRQYASRHAEAIELAQAAERDARAVGRVDLQVRAIGIHGMARAKSVDYDAGLDMVRGGLAIALEHGLTDAAAQLYQMLSVALYQSGDYARAEHALDTALELCETAPDRDVVAACTSCLAYVLYERGEWARAAAMCRDMIAAGGSWVADGLLGAICAGEGRLTSARRLLASSLVAAERSDNFNMTVLITTALARVAAAEGETAEAADRCRAVLARWRRSQDRHYAVAGLRWSAGFLAGQGDDAGAHACADALARIASSSGHGDALAALAHAIGECALLQGDTAAAAQQLARAVELHAELGIPFERADIELRAGVVAAAAGDRERGLAFLADAHRTARALGARPLAAAVAQEVERLGASATEQLGRRAAASADATGLSRREREVLRLVSAGQTNREIASDLVLSQRTVDMHVRNILRKLDCRSRVDAAVRARELDLAT